MYNRIWPRIWFRLLTQYLIILIHFNQCSNHWGFIYSHGAHRLTVIKLHSHTHKHTHTHTHTCKCTCHSHTQVFARWVLEKLRRNFVLLSLAQRERPHCLSHSVCHSLSPCDMTRSNIRRRDIPATVSQQLPSVWCFNRQHRLFRLNTYSSTLTSSPLHLSSSSSHAPLCFCSSFNSPHQNILKL